VTLATREASIASQEVLTMCLRAFEFLPPVDVTFADYLRAVVTADFELNPQDDFQRRASFIDAFRARGIFARDVTSLAEEALRLERPAELDQHFLPHSLVTNTLASEFDFLDEGGLRRRRQATFGELHVFAKDYAQHLQLDPDLDIQIKGFHPSFHVGENGQLVVELIAQFVQTPKVGDDGRVEAGGVVLRGGTTAVFAADGSVRYIASRPLPGSHLTPSQLEIAKARVKDFLDYVGDLDQQDALQVWSGSGYADSRMSRRADLGASHRARRSWVTK
jgi:hypothetical protein